MSRFSRFTRISPEQLLRRRERRAWFSLSATLGVLAGTAALLGLQAIRIQQQGDIFFHAPDYAVPAQEQPSAPPPICRAVPPAPDITPHLLQADAPDALPPEQVDDSELSAIAAEPLPPPQQEWLPPLIPTSAHTNSAPAVNKEKTTPASPFRTPPPPYPARMRQRRIEGDVGICIHIDASGTPTAVDILTEVHPDFAEHTRRWILSHWRFYAALKGQQSIASTLHTTIRYRLR